MEKFSLRGKSAIITGAGRGIGRGIALAMAEAGAEILISSRTEEELHKTAEEVKKLGGICIPFRADITKPDDVRRMKDKALSEFGKIDILVNNAGMFIMKPFVYLPDLKTRLVEIVEGFEEPLGEGDWRAIFETNFFGVLLCLKEVVPHMIERRKGKIINVSSIEAVKPLLYHSVYSATKGALSTLTKALALEWARYNINVNAIGPGYVETGMTTPFFADEKAREHMLREIPMRRFPDPREIGYLAVFLASDASDYITGQTIFIDGGLTIR